MNKRFLTYSIFLALAGLGISQANAQQTLKIGTNPTTVTNSAVLDVEATNKGALLPRVALTGTNDIATIASPANALTVFNTATAGTAPNAVTPGYYYYSTPSAKWVRLVGSDDPSLAWNTIGNAGINPANNFLGTTDAQPLNFKLNNIASGAISPVNSNVSFGFAALSSNTNPDDLPAQIDNPRTTGITSVQRNRSVAIGYRSMGLMKDPRQMVAIGAFAMGSATGTPFSSVAIGYRSLYSVQTSVPGNTALGWNTLSNNISGGGNTAIGAGSLSEVGNDGTGLNINGNIAIGAGNGVPQNATAFDNNILLGNNYVTNLGTTIQNQLYIGNNYYSNFNNTLNTPVKPIIIGNMETGVLTINNTLKVADLGSSATATTGNRPIVADVNGQLMIGTAASAAPAIVTKTADYTATAADETLLVNAASTNVTITMPASPATGQKFNIKKIDTGSNSVTINGNGKNIDGNATITGTLPYQGWTVQYDGTAWYIISRI